jgi:hypothetical protein
MGKRNNNVADRDVGENEEETGGRYCNASGVCNRSTLKWVVAVIVSVNILVFGVYNLPFFSKGREHDGQDTIGNKKVQVQAKFMLRKPLSTIDAHVLELKLDIWDEIGIPDAEVKIISLAAESNGTKVVFGVVPSQENTSISSASLSVLRETFVGLVLGQYNLSLKSSGIFGRAYSFQVLVFPGGITVVPTEQTRFPLQHVQVLFNFTLLNSIYQVHQNLAQLKQQLDTGLQVRSDENLFVQLTNLKGSTVASPIIIETSIVPVVGSLTVPRLKQLAQEITGKHAGNLGLNPTLFGEVNQIRLSSYLKDPDLSPSSSPSPSPSPSPAPSPSPTHSTSSPMRAPLSNPYPAPSVPDTPHQHATPPSYHHAYTPSNDNPPAHCHHHHDYHSSKCKHQHHARHAPASGLNGAPSPTPYIDHHVGVAPAPISITTSPPSQSVPPFKSPPCHTHRPYFPSISPSPSSGPLPSGSQFIPSPPVSPSHSPSHADISRPSSHIARPPSNSGPRVPSPKSSHFSPVTFTNVSPPESSRQPHSESPHGNPPVSHFPRLSSSSFDVGIPVKLIIHSTVFVGALLIYLL